MAGKKNIALFAGILENEYTSAVISGAVRGARECDVNLIVFPMDIIGAKYLAEDLHTYRYQYNVLSAFMNAESIDGCIIEYGTITSFLDENQKRKFLEQTKDKPTILIAERAEGYASVCMDNESGLKEVIEHLIVDHKYKKIGLLSGPKYNYDAMKRKNVFVKTMEEHGAFLGEDWIAYGDFSEYISDVIEEFYNTHPDVEAIVCANDNMAIGAAKFFESRGIIPGKDIFLTGFDDLVSGLVFNPSLTTVNADPEELSRKAVCELCKENFTKDKLRIPTKMVKRQSCGCCTHGEELEFKKRLGISSDWREMAKNQMEEDATRHSLERELGNASRELVFVMGSEEKKNEAILNVMRRFMFKSCAIFLYDEFIKNRREDEWHNPETVNLVGYYLDQDMGNIESRNKGELVAKTGEIFNWGVVRDGARHEIAVFPLFFGDKQIGLLAVESDPKYFMFAYDIAGQISSTYYTSDSFERQKRMKNDLEFANKSKSHFLANMSHEIRTPINAIIGFNEMILRESKDESILEYAKDVQGAADALLLLVNDTLDFSKIEAGKMELIIDKYNLNSILKNVHGMMTPRAKDKNLELRLESDEQLPQILEGDAGRLQQILINLLSNAIKYTQEGSVVLRVFGTCHDDIASICFEVIDTGNGIRKEDIKKLFNLFERIEEKRNRNIEGTGLGINIVVGLLKLMNSELKVESEYGVGSKFSFTIDQKIIAEGQADSGDENRGGNSGNAVHASFKAKDVRILVVDDNFLNRKVIRSLLKGTEIELDLAKSGYECIEMAKNGHYDLILLDHMMPQMDGIETLGILLNEGIVDTAVTPVIALTANAISGAREEYISKGFSDYLAKPVLPKNLYKMLRDYISEDKIIV